MNKASILLVSLAALGLGALIGTSLLGSPEPAPLAAAVDSGGAPVFRYLEPGQVEVSIDDFGRPVPSTVAENFVQHNGEFATESLTITLDVDAEAEYKALMEQGDAVVYSWTTDGGDVYYDFHAHAPAFGDEFFTRYAEGEGASDSGAIVAPYSGQHGWYWLNIASEPVTITLSVAGFYEDIVEIDVSP